MMKRNIYGRIFLCLGSFHAVAAAPCAAREAGADNGPAWQDLQRGRRDRITDVTYFDYSHASDHVRSAEWETGGLRLRGARVKTGRKASFAPTIGRQWHREFRAGVQAWQDIAGGVTGRAGLRFTRVTSGSLGGALLTRRTGYITQEAYIGLGAGNGASVTLSVFDRGGWNATDAIDFANRITNGEERAKKGAAFEVGIPLPALERNVGDAPRFALTLEQTEIPSLGAESAARIAVGMHF